MDLLGEDIRYVEANVLDKHHEQQPLLQRSQIEAVSHILKVYGNLLRDFKTTELAELATMTRLSEQDSWDRGLEQSLRWILKHCKPHSSFSKDYWRVIDEEALLLLSWARSYIKLCDAHTAGSRGLYVASLDKSLHEITFQFKKTVDFNVYLSQIAAYPFHVNEVIKDFPVNELDKAFNQIKRKINFEKLNEPESLPFFENNFLDLNHILILIKQWTRSTILSELDDCEYLDGFTLGNLRDFWACLTLECYLITNLENYVDIVVGDENDLGSVMLQDDPVELSEYLAKNFKMDARVVLEILNCLTFDKNSHKSTLVNSPFFMTECGTLSLLCRQVVNIDPYIMISSTLAKRSRKPIYEALIHKIEKKNLINIGVQFQNIGFDILIEKEFVSKENSKICPDLIAYDRESNQILIADYKHAIPPIGAAEVSNRIRDLEKWNQQIRRYLYFFNNNEEMLRDTFDYESIPAVYAMILFRWGMHVPIPVETDITYANWSTLLAIFKTIEKPKISDIFIFFKLPRDTDQVICQWEIFEASTQVDKWTYRTPMIALKSE